MNLPRGLLVTPIIVIGAIGMAGRPGTPAIAVAQVRNADCVTIAKPKPATVYEYQHVENRGRTTRTTNQWESVTETTSRVRTTGPAGVQIAINEYRVADDVAVLSRMSKQTAGGALIDATAFQPGLIGDPIFRACAGRSWPIPSVTASYRSTQTNASSATPVGTLRIIAIREKVTVPAGTFETVHYTRTSQSVDEYWKSIEHGVVVKHLATVMGNVVTETLTAIK